MEEETIESSLFGTPLKPIDENDRAAQIRPKPIAVHEQIVTDDKGRRRFHGAFTGGFSAGYFNTAGSKDGWAPKTFKSSRLKKDSLDNGKEEKNKFQQRHEDFMDEEDLAHFGIAPKKLQASSNFFQKGQPNKTNTLAYGMQDDFEKRNARLGQISEIFRGPDEKQTSIPFGQPVLEQLFIPIRETIGARLLREMGWKPGQGIGPRITKSSKHLKKKAHKRLYGKEKASLHISSEEEEEKIDEIAEKYREFLFAPDDIGSNLITKAKDNLFGIEYKGLDRNEQTSSQHFNLFTSVLSVSDDNHKRAHARQPSKKIIGQAFGVGVYEDEDEDIYAKEDVTSYDFYLDNSKGSDKNKDENKRISRWEKKQDVDQCLPGFVPAKITARIYQSAKFPLPKLPKNYHPKPIKKTRFESKPDMGPGILSPKEEEKTSPPYSKIATGKSECIETKLEDNLLLNSQEQTHRDLADPALSNQKVTESAEELRTLVETIQNQHKATTLIQSESSAITTSFKPYVNDPPKQKRYEQYLICLKNGRRDALSILQPKDMTEWERNREQTEFDRAAVLYHDSEVSKSQGSRGVPGGSIMYSRFVSAKSNEELDVGKEATSTSKKNKLTLTEAEKAAKLKCYGKLTRETVDWHPSRILCIRFNVKQPYGDSSIIGVPSGYKCRLDIFKNVDKAIVAQTNNGDHKIDSKYGNTDKAEPINKDIVDKYSNSKPDLNVKPVLINETSEENFKKASNDLFKAIFLDSEASDESDNDVTIETFQKSLDTTEKGSNASPRTDNISEISSLTAKKNPSDNMSSSMGEENRDSDSIQIANKPLKQAKGLFANIDFSTFKKKKVEQSVNNKNDNSVIIGPSRKRPVALDFLTNDINGSDNDSDKDKDAFGPKKPKNLEFPSNNTATYTKKASDADSSDEWIEESSRKSKKRSHSKGKKKKDKKHKHKKDKKKKGHKKDSHRHSKSSKKEKFKTKKKRSKHRRRSSESSTSTSSYEESSSELSS